MRVPGLGWIAWVIAGLALEGLALHNDIPNDTLSGTIATHIPAWITWLALGWLVKHGIEIYLNRRDER